ncbi:MAG: S8 family peptidase [Gemmatimonadetes bacterium]|nr:S8 family peptidase [Gemmatimonadota bacterium]
MSRWPRAERARVSRGWHWLVPAAAIAFVGCTGDRLPSEPEPESQFSASAQAAGAGADDWIVVFKDGTQDPPGLARRLVAANGGSIRFTYSHALRGFAGNLPPQAIEAIQKNPNVAYVERDGLMTKTVVGSWGLDRIDQRDLPLNNTYSADYDGTGVDVYIIDTGIDYATYSDGDQFGSRLDQSRDYDFVDKDNDASDCDGHGTHVSGTVGSRDYGVARNVTLIGVRVLNCQGSGSYAGVIAGIDYVAATAASVNRPSVANMSLGGGFSSSVNNAVNNAVAGGVTFAVSSGNSNADACGYSPASAASAITVNSSTSSDARSSFSNYGTCTDIFAPGSGIRSTIMGGGTQSWSGTSMASPHVAGVAALLLHELGDVGPAAVWTAMQDHATRDKITSAGSGSPNLLLYSGTDGGGDPGCGESCPEMGVQWISAVSVKSNKNRRASGTVTVEIVDANGGAALPGVVVSGDWTVTGTATSSTGTTGSDGRVTLSSGNIRNATDFSFCVTGLSKIDFKDVSDGAECSTSSVPWGEDPPPPPPPPPGAGAPVELVGSSSKKGRNWRANLVWEDGGATVDVWRGSTKRASAISNSHSYTDNVGKSPPAYTYKVCNAGSTTDCSNVFTVTFQ